MSKHRAPAPGNRHPGLTAADRERIAAAVTAAEAHTAGEIVTVLAEASDHYEDIALLWAALMALLALAGLSLAPRAGLGLVEQTMGYWDMRWAPEALLSLAAGVITVAFAATWSLLQWTTLRIALVPGPVKHARVRARALDHYRVGTETRTSGGTGVLIYLSRRERRAEIVTDANVTAAIPVEEWGAAMAAMIALVADGRIADGMIEAVDRIGAVLSRHFPSAAHDVNELPNRLIEI